MGGGPNASNGGRQQTARPGSPGRAAPVYDPCYPPLLPARGAARSAGGSRRQCGVATFLLEEGLVGAPLDDAAVVEDDDLVGVADR